MLRSMDGKSRINLWNWKESGIEKVQVLKGKWKEKKEKARQGQGKARKCQRIQVERRKERTWKEKKRKEVFLARIYFPFFSFFLFLLIFDSGRRELRVNYI